MKLYYFPDACSLAPHIALRETRCIFTLIAVDYNTRQLPDGTDYRLVNPRGSVPTLQLDNKELLTEAPIILQYIATRSAAHDLFPSSDDFDRYRCLEWLNYVATELHKSVSPLFRATTPKSFMQPGKDHLSARYDFIDRHLRQHDYLSGGRYSIADIYLYVVSRWLAPLRLDINRWPGVARHQYRISQRPAVRAALAAEGLSGG